MLTRSCYNPVSVFGSKPKMTPFRRHVFAWQNCQKCSLCNNLTIVHPATILRMDQSRQGLAIRRTEDVLITAFNSLVPF